MGTYPIGVMVNNLERDRLRAFGEAVRCGFRVVHTSALAESWLTGPERPKYVAAARDSGVVIDTMFVGFDGQSYQDRPTIARTVGLVIPELRPHRCQVALHYSDLARELGVSSLAMHLGFLPHDPRDPNYGEVIQALRGILDHYRKNGQTLHLETGQESAADLERFIQEVDRPNLGVNFDPANFLIYATDRPLPALGRLAPYVRGVHCKDARWPVQEGQLGREVPIGQGEVAFPALLRRLREIGFAGPLIIEREHGPRVREDVREAAQYLGQILAEL